MFKLEIETDNDAFQEYGEQELRRILQEIDKQLYYGITHDTVLDINGNVVGHWKYNI